MELNEKTGEEKPVPTLSLPSYECIVLHLKLFQQNTFLHLDSYFLTLDLPSLPFHVYIVKMLYMVTFDTGYSLLNLFRP